MQKRIAHKVFLWSHRWFGLVGGLYFVAFGLTGSYLVYDGAIDALMYPDRFVSASESETIDVPAVVAIAQAGLQTTKQPTRVTFPEGASKNAVLQFNLAEVGTAPQNRVVYVDPSNGSYKGSFDRLESLGGLMSVFHHDLFLGAATGRFWMGVSGIPLLFILLSGLWIWWPKTHLLSRSLKWPKLRSLYKASLDLHKLFGIYTLVLMIAVTFSGLYISVPGWFQFGEQKGGGPRPGGGGPQMTSEIPPIDFPAVQAALSAQGLLKRPLNIGYNGREKNIQIRGGHGSPVYVYDPAAGSLTAKVEEAKGFEMRRFQREVHGGEYWGIVGGILTFISGLLPLFFFISGFYVWWKKSRLQKGRAV